MSYHSGTIILETGTFNWHEGEICFSCRKMQHDLRNILSIVIFQIFSTCGILLLDDCSGEALMHFIWGDVGMLSTSSAKDRSFITKAGWYANVLPTHLCCYNQPLFWLFPGVLYTPSYDFSQGMWHKLNCQNYFWDSGWTANCVFFSIRAIFNFFFNLALYIKYI